LTLSKGSCGMEGNRGHAALAWGAFASAGSALRAAAASHRRELRTNSTSRPATILSTIFWVAHGGPPREAPIPLDGPDPRTVRRPRGEGYEPKRSKRSPVSSRGYFGAFISVTLASFPFSEMNSTPAGRPRQLSNAKRFGLAADAQTIAGRAAQG
jgi:hypothetical protein